MTLPASGAISFNAINVELCRAGGAQLSLNDSAVRTLFGQASGAVCMNTGHGKSNTSVPGAPTGVSASASSSSAISVSFSAPASNGGLTIDYYQVVCTSSGSNSATGASSPISVTGLSASTSYTFKVRAHNSKGYGCYSSSTGTATTSAPRGCIVYCTQGTYSWTAPAGVTSVSVFAVEAAPNGYDATYYCQLFCSYNGYRAYISYGGCGGRGGGTSYRNSIPVTPGQSYQVTVGGTTGFSNSSFNLTATCSCYKVRGQVGYDAIGCYTWGGGHSNYYWQGYFSAPWQGTTSQRSAGSGGGAAGYGPWVSCRYSGGARDCGAGIQNGRLGGGGAGNIPANFSKMAYGGGGGGGVGLYGKGSNGQFQGPVNGSNAPINAYCSCIIGSQGGGGGSGGTSGSNGSSNGTGGNGGNYGGGGGGGGCRKAGGNGIGGAGGKGAVRIVWPGSSRQFPTTDVGTP